MPFLYCVKEASIVAIWCVETHRNVTFTWQKKCNESGNYYWNCFWQQRM